MEPRPPYEREESLSEFSESLNARASAYGDLGEYAKALEFFREAERLFQFLGEWACMICAVDNQVNILTCRGELDEAMDLNFKLGAFCWEIGDRVGYARTFGNEANILEANGQYDGALELAEEEISLCRAHGNLASLARALDNTANILYCHDELDEAMELRKEEEMIWWELGDKARLENSLRHQEDIIKDRGY